MIQHFNTFQSSIDSKMEMKCFLIPYFSIIIQVIVFIHFQNVILMPQSMFWMTSWLYDYYLCIGASLLHLNSLCSVSFIIKPGEDKQVFISSSPESVPHKIIKSDISNLTINWSIKREHFKRNRETFCNPTFHLC